jgi:hypothetical protein
MDHKTKAGRTEELGATRRGRREDERHVLR